MAGFDGPAQLCGVKQTTCRAHTRPYRGKKSAETPTEAEGVIMAATLVHAETLDLVARFPGPHR